MAARKPGADEQTDLIDAGWQSPDEQDDGAVVDEKPLGLRGDEVTIEKDVSEFVARMESRLDGSAGADERAGDGDDALIRRLPAPLPVGDTVAADSPPAAADPAGTPTAEVASRVQVAPEVASPAQLSSEAALSVQLPGAPSVASTPPTPTAPAGAAVTGAVERLGSPLPAPATSAGIGVASGAVDSTTMAPTTPPTVAPSVPAVSVPVAAGLVVLAAVFAGVVGFLGGRFSVPVATVSPTDGELPAISATASANEPTSLQLAASGQPEALDALEAKSLAERSLAESLVLGRGRDARLQRRLDEIERRLSSNPGLIQDHRTRQELWELAGDARTATRVLGIVARWPGSEGPDFLYRVWIATPERTDTTRLAEELVYSPDLRARASPELEIVLDLRRVQDCDEARRLIAVAQKKGDQRALRPLGRLAKRTGCGENEQQDCFPCLRKDEEPLTAAIRAVRLRRSPNVP